MSAPARTGLVRDHADVPARIVGDFQDSCTSLSACPSRAYCCENSGWCRRRLAANPAHDFHSL
jgi:hypothetical protein